MDFPGEESYNKKRTGGLLVANFEKNHLRATKILFCGRDVVQILKPHFFLSYYFRLNALKCTAKAPTVDILKLNTLRGTKTTFSILKRYNQPPLLLYVSSPGWMYTSYLHIADWNCIANVKARERWIFSRKTVS